VSFEYDYLLTGTQKSHLEDGGLSTQDSDTGQWYILDELVNDQDRGFGIRWNVKFEKLGKNVDWFVKGFVRFWHIGESDPKQETSNGGSILWVYSGSGLPVMGYEPDNNTTEYGASAGIRF